MPAAASTWRVLDESPGSRGAGVRLGTPAGTTRGFGVAEFKQIGGFIVEVLDGVAAKGEEGDSAVEASVKQRVHALTERFPIYG